MQQLTSPSDPSRWRPSRWSRSRSLIVTAVLVMACTVAAGSDGVGTTTVAASSSPRAREASSTTGSRPAHRPLGPAPRLTAGDRQPSERVAPRAEADIIDTSDRAAVAAAYRTRYLPQFSVAQGWTGSVAGCQAGTVSAAYRAATLETVNYFRDMAGLPGVVLGAGLNGKGQAAALIMDASGTLTHAPTSDMPCYTAAGYDGASHSNLCFGCIGPGAVEAYMADRGAGNTAAGHRRWVLYPPQTTLGTGSTGRADALYVLDGATWLRPADAPTWVSWPPAGFVPSDNLYPRFSLSRQGADFSSATAQVTVDGQALSSSVVSRTAGYGDPAIVIEVILAGLDLGRDRTFTITVDGIGVGGATVSRSWQSTSFVPTLPGAVEITPASKDFGGIVVGATSTARVFTVANSGPTDVHLGSLHLGGTDPGQFTRANDGCSGQTLGPSATCSVDVSFSPTATGDRTARLVVPSDAAGSPDGASLAGSGVAAAHHRADGRIRRGTGGTLAGDGIYDATGAGQSRRASLAPGASVGFRVSIQNDGNVADRFAVQAAGNARGYAVTYRSGTRDITSAVIAGTFVTRSLAPGASQVIRVAVRVMAAAPRGSNVSRLVTIASDAEATERDAVRFIVARG